MKRSTLSVLFVTLILFSGVFAEEVMGCPKGIMKGAIWPRVAFKTIDATQKWNKNKEEMVDLSDGLGLKKMIENSYSVRLGYGVLNHLDVGIDIRYTTVETEKEKSITGGGSRLLDFEESAVSKIWLSGKYMFLDKSKLGPLTYLKLSSGGCYGFATAKDSAQLVSGLGPGVDEFKLGLLFHGGLFSKDFEFAGHTLYHGRGTAPEQKGFSRSGQKISDTFDYMFKFEYGLIDYIGLSAGFNGWLGIDKDESLSDSGGETMTAYSHNANFMLEFFPFKSSNYEKRKIFTKLSFPYTVRNTSSPDYILIVAAMWAFYI